MKSASATPGLCVFALLIANVSCNSLLDIEPHELAPADAGDASVSLSSGEADQDGGRSTDPGTSLRTEGPAASGSEPLVTSNGTAETEYSPSSPTGSHGDQTDGTPQDAPSSTSGALASSTSGALASSTSSSVSSEPPPDPRETMPGPPNLAAAFDCASKLDAWGYTSYCRFTPNGFDELGNPLTNVGDAHVWLYWSDAVLDGWICMIDNVSNGRGLQYRVLVHGEGDPLPSLPTNEVTPEDAWQLIYTDRDEGSTCVWKAFSATLPKRVDHVMIEWLDLWSDNEHFDGRLIVQAP